jgi:hypothetical protein
MLSAGEGGLEMSEGVIIGAAIGAVFGIVMIIVGATRKGSAATMAHTPRMELLFCDIPREQAVERIVAAAGSDRYVVPYSDPQRGEILLATPLTLFSFGFFYPIYVLPKEGRTRVDVGIKSKAFQWGPVVTRNHRQCVALVRRALDLDAT